MGTSKELGDLICSELSRVQGPQFEPTGVMEPVIKSVGEGKYFIIFVYCANKLGKTAIAANILKNIFWEHDPDFFDYPLFREWPFNDASGNIIKKGRIIGTVKNTKDTGPIREEVLKWWPPRYECAKGGKTFYSEYVTDTGYDFDVMTYEQKPEELEGPLLSWAWLDEPPPPEFLGPILSRFPHGGIILFTMTPINAGVFIDELQDLEDKGTKIKRITGSIFDNSKESGLANSKGRMRGLMTEQEIKDYVKRIPLHEQDERIYGKITKKAGKVYPDFNREVHVRDILLKPDFNYYMVIDPHRKYYPFMQWWAVTPDEKYYCWNEWPDKGELGGYYDEMRTLSICPYEIETLAHIIKIKETTGFKFEKPNDYQILKRFIDPRFARGTEGEYGRSTEGIRGEYAKLGLLFESPPHETIGEQRNKIINLMNYDKQKPVSVVNEPAIYFHPRCINSIRAFERHSWDEHTQKENEKYKDPVDCTRYFFSGLGDKRYEKVHIKKPVFIRPAGQEYTERLGDIELG